MRLTATILLILLVLGAARPAHAHGVDLFARVEGSNLVGSMAFADGTPVSHRPVKAFAPDGALLEETQTDEAGHFTLPIRAKVRHRLIGEAGEGHRGLYTVPETEIILVASETDRSVVAGEESDGAVEGAPISVQTLEAVVARQLGPLRDQLHAHEKKVRLQDAIGGIGYIFGVLGLYVLLKQRLARRDSR